jgi:hypothetical protein
LSTLSAKPILKACRVTFYGSNANFAPMNRLISTISLLLMLLLAAGCLTLPVDEEEREAIEAQKDAGKTKKGFTETDGIDLDKYGQVWISIDGGAMFGIVPLVLLQDIEDSASRNTRSKPQPLYKYVRGFYGISTGAIISALLTMPTNKGGPLSAAQALAFYKSRGKGDEKDKAGIFQDELLETAFLKTGKDTDTAKAKLAENFKKAADDTFSDLTLSSVSSLKSAQGDQVHLGMFTYRRFSSGSSNRGSMYIFGNGAFDLYNEPNVVSGQVRVSDAVQAAAALTKLFGEKTILFPKLNGAPEPRYFVDLGEPTSIANGPVSQEQVEGLNDPTFIVAEILQKYRPGERITIVSFGTGWKPPHEKTAELARLNNPNLIVLRIDPKPSEIATLVNGFIDAASAITGTRPTPADAKSILAAAPHKGSFDGFAKLRLIGQNITMGEDKAYRTYRQTIKPLLVKLAMRWNP